MARKNGSPLRALALGNTAMSVLPAQFEEVQMAPGFAVTINGLQVTGTPSRERWERTGESLRVTERANAFALGDWFNFGVDRYGDDVWQTIDDSAGWKLSTIKAYGWLAASVPKAVRRLDRLGIKHHMLVAAMAPAKQQEWLDRAANDGADDDGVPREPWSASRLAKAIREGDDALPTALWVLVAASDEADQGALMAMLTSQGRSVKPVTRRGRKAG